MRLSIDVSKEEISKLASQREKLASLGLIKNIGMKMPKMSKVFGRIGKNYLNGPLGLLNLGGDMFTLKVNSNAIKNTGKGLLGKPLFK